MQRPLNATTETSLIVFLQQSEILLITAFNYMRPPSIRTCFSLCSFRLWRKTLSTCVTAALSCLASHSTGPFNYPIVIFPWPATSPSQN